MKIGFDTSNEEETAEEPDIGHAESNQYEDSYWWDTAYPTLLNFVTCYGIFSVIRDLIRTCRGGSNGTNV